MPSPKKPNQPRAEWQERHTHALVESLITTALNRRTEIYAHPILQEVNDHGSDRIRKALEKILGEVAVGHGLGKGAVQAAKGGGSPGKKAKAKGKADTTGGEGEGEGGVKRKKAKVEEHEGSSE